MPLVNRGELESALSIPLPRMKDIRSMLRYNAYGSSREKVLGAYIVGSVAKGTNGEGSDLDIAVIIAEKKTVSSCKYTERYHQKFLDDKHKPHWHGIRVDFQFYYSTKSLSEFHKMDCSK